MSRSAAEDVGRLSPAKDGSEAAARFNRRTLCFFIRVNYKASWEAATSASRSKGRSGRSPFSR